MCRVSVLLLSREIYTHINTHSWKCEAWKDSGSLLNKQESQKTVIEFQAESTPENQKKSWGTMYTESIGSRRLTDGSTPQRSRG